jgi:glycosyltransferase involved in cell wall biosynthesis
MKILFYNWVQYDDPEKRGGGVAIYQRHHIAKMTEDSRNEIFFLSSGLAYNYFRRKVYYRSTSNIYGKNCRTFEIVNSAVTSPGHSCYDADAVLSDAETTRVLLDFINRYGPFDVIHLDNLEGMPAEMLTLKEVYPDTKLILMLHNYYTVCPQVNLWKGEEENCSDFNEGRDCINCLPHRIDRHAAITAHRLSFFLKTVGITPGSSLYRLIYRNTRIIYRPYSYLSRLLRNLEWKRDHAKKPNVLEELTSRASFFVLRRKTFVSLVNDHVDKVMVVSRRVGVIAEQYGINKNKIQLSYIGTVHAKKQANYSLRQDYNDSLTLCYLGYMRKDKGFYFLLSALESMPNEMAKRINVLFAAGNNDDDAYERIELLCRKFNKVFYINGYTHEQLDEILSEVDLGIIPVLWEDNLPQVAIEMVSRGVPLLTSDLGGARELGNNQKFIFRNGDVADFTARIQQILNRDIMLSEYWDHAMSLVTFDDHVKQLDSIYKDNNSL